MFLQLSLEQRKMMKDWRAGQGWHVEVSYVWPAKWCKCHLQPGRARAASPAGMQLMRRDRMEALWSSP